MKIRMSGNSLRLRLTRSEVKAMSDDLQVTETVHIGSNKLSYHLLSVDQIKPTADFILNEIIVSIPKTFSSNWYASDVTGIDAMQINSDDTALHILVEKDFACLDAKGEDQNDYYENLKS